MNMPNQNTDITERAEPQAVSNPVLGDSMLRVSVAATMLGVHPNTIRIWTETGVLKSCRIGPRKDRRISLATVRMMLE